MKLNKWMFWAIGLVIFSILTITFLWQEYNIFCFEETANTEKISQYFTAIGALLSGIGLILIAKQIKISERVRMDTFRPDVFPENVSSFNISNFSYARVHIWNGGSGIAKNIKCRWILNNENIENKVNNEDITLFLTIQCKCEIRLPDRIRLKLLNEFEDFNEFRDIDLGVFELTYQDREGNQYSPKYKFKASQIFNEYETIFYL